MLISLSSRQDEDGWFAVRLARGYTGFVVSAVSDKKPGFSLVAALSRLVLPFLTSIVPAPMSYTLAGWHEG